MKARILPVFLAIAATSGHAAAALYASDNFTNSTASGSTTVSNTEATGTGSYRRTYTGTSSTYTVETISGFGNGNVLTLGNGDSTHVRNLNGGAAFSLSSLAAGDRLSMDFDIRVSGTFSTEGSRMLSFGFINTSATSSILYGLVGEAGGEFRRRTESSNMSTTSTSGGARIGDAFAHTFEEDTNYHFRLEITKLAPDNYLLRYLRDSTEIASTTSDMLETSAIDINAIGFRWSSPPGVTTHLDNIVVELIPEPSSAVLLAGAIAFACGIRKRR